VPLATYCKTTLTPHLRRQALYRVDRNWPQLPDWLVRAFSLQKRQAKGYKGGDSGPEAEASGKSTGTAGSSSSSSSSSSSEKGPLPEAEKLAKEVGATSMM